MPKKVIGPARSCPQTGLPFRKRREAQSHSRRLSARTTQTCPNLVACETSSLGEEIVVSLSCHGPAVSIGVTLQYLPDVFQQIIESLEGRRREVFCQYSSLDMLCACWCVLWATCVCVFLGENEFEILFLLFLKINFFLVFFFTLSGLISYKLVKLALVHTRSRLFWIKFKNRDETG